MVRKKIIYECEYCGREYNEWEECDKCEKRHIRDYSDADTAEIADALKKLGESAYGYRIGGTVLGIPVTNFETLIREAVKRLEDSLN